MNQSETGQFLGTEKISKLMLKFSVPCVLSLLVSALYNIVDQIFIANASYLGSYGNATNTVVFPLTVVALAIAVIFGLTLSTVVTLIFIPVLYMWMNERKRKSNARKTAKQIAKNAKLHAEELARERAAQNNAKPV